MTSILNEATASLLGAYRLAHFDPRGMSYFNTSIEGIWRSFGAAVIVAPLYAILLAVVYPTMNPAPDVARFVIVELEGYVVSWVAYPLVIAWMTMRLGCWDRFAAYIVAYNWATVFANLVTISINIARIGELIPAEAGDLLWLVGITLVLVYLWFVARTALAISALAAAGIIAADLFLSIVIGMTVSRLHWPLS